MFGALSNLHQLTPLLSSCKWVNRLCACLGSRSRSFELDFRVPLHTGLIHSHFSRCEEEASSIAERSMDSDLDFSVPESLWAQRPGLLHRFKYVRRADNQRRHGL